MPDEAMRQNDAKIWGQDIALGEWGQAKVAANGELILTSGVDTGVQDIMLRLFIRLGTLFYDSDFGSLISDWFYEESTRRSRDGFLQEVARRVEMDPRVAMGTVRAKMLKWDEKSIHVEVSWRFITQDHAMNLVLQYDKSTRLFVVNGVNFAGKVFAIGALAPLHGCELVWSREQAWPEGGWPDKAWAIDARWDRRLPKWGIMPSGIYKSQGVYSDFTLVGHDWRPLGKWAQKPWGDLHYYKDAQTRNLAGGKFPPSAWSAPNCNWSWPVAKTVTYDEPVWSETDWRWNTGRKEHYEIIEEQFYDCRFALVNPPQPEDAWTESQWVSRPWRREFNHVAGELNGFGAQRLAATLKNHLAPVWSESAWSDFYPRRYGGLANFGHLAMIAPCIRLTRHWEDKPWPQAIWEAGSQLAQGGEIWPENVWSEAGWGYGPANLGGKGGFCPVQAHGALAKNGKPAEPPRALASSYAIFVGRDDSWQDSAWHPGTWGRLPGSASGVQIMRLHGQKSEARPESGLGEMRTLAGRNKRADSRTCVHFSRSLYFDGLNARSWQDRAWPDEQWWLPPETNLQPQSENIL